MSISLLNLNQPSKTSINPIVWDITVQNTATINNLVIVDNLTIDGNLTVDGTATTNFLLVIDNATVDGNLSIVGTETVNTIVTSSTHDLNITPTTGNTNIIGNITTTSLTSESGNLLIKSPLQLEIGSTGLSFYQEDSIILTFGSAIPNTTSTVICTRLNNIVSLSISPFTATCNSASAINSTSGIASQYRPISTMTFIVQVQTNTNTYTGAVFQVFSTGIIEIFANENFGTFTTTQPVGLAFPTCVSYNITT